MSVGFQWDKSKARLNLQKHGVSFEEAITVFDDVLAVIFDDPTHSAKERREIIIGHSLSHRLILICFTERADIIRVFSARPLTRAERKEYEENID